MTLLPPGFGELRLFTAHLLMYGGIDGIAVCALSHAHKTSLIQYMLTASQLFLLPHTAECLVACTKAPPVVRALLDAYHPRNPVTFLPQHYCQAGNASPG